jgi:hypothetical protein
MQSRPPTEAAADSFVFCLANFGEITWWARLAAPSVSLVVNNDADFYTGSETTGHRNGRLCLYAAHSHSLVVVDVMDVPAIVDSYEYAVNSTYAAHFAFFWFQAARLYTLKNAIQAITVEFYGKVKFSQRSRHQLGIQVGQYPTSKENILRTWNRMPTALGRRARPRRRMGDRD